MNIEQKGRTDLSRTDDFFVPSSIATMFWRPRFLVDCPAMLHTPFLFWLTSAEAPRRLAVCGAPDGAVFFALCQALDKQNIVAQCQWFGGWKDAANQNFLTEPPKLLCDHAVLLYDDIARLTASVAPSKAAESLRPNSIDLLFVEFTEQSLVNRNNWLHCLKDTGLLVLHGTRAQQGKEQQELEDFLVGKNKIEFQIGDGLTVVLKDKGRSAHLDTLLRVCSEGYIPGDIALLFTRLGQGVHAAAKEAEVTAQLTKTRASLKAAENKIEEELSPLRDLVEERSRKLSELQMRLFDTEQNQTRVEKANTKLQNSLDTLLTEKAALEKTHANDRARNEAAQSMRFEEIAELIRQLEMMRKRLEEKDTEVASLQAQQGALWQQVENAQSLHDELSKLRSENKALKDGNAALLNSTSWRLTSPLRRFRSNF